MKIQIKVVPNSKKETVSEEKGILKIRTNAPAKEGKANKAVISLLSNYLKVPKSRISIARGKTSENKIIEIQ